MLKLILVVLAAISLYAAPLAVHSSDTVPAPRAVSSDKDVVCFNTSNNKFHSLSCTWAKRCTVNCIRITRAEAHSRGGIPCKVCGGGEDG
jgi:hypothetical protein